MADQNFNNALKIVQQRDTDEKNFRGAMTKLGEFIQAAIDAKKTTDESDAHLAANETRVGELRQEETNLRKAIPGLTTSVAELKKQFRDTTAELEAAKQELAGLQGEVEGAKAMIAKGEEAHRVLSSLASH